MAPPLRWPEARGLFLGIAVAAGLPAGCSVSDDFRRRYLVPVMFSVLLAVLGTIGIVTSSARLVAVYALDALALAIGWSCYLFDEVRLMRHAQSGMPRAAWAAVLGACAAAWLASALLARLFRARLVGMLVVERGEKYEMALL